MAVKKGRGRKEVDYDALVGGATDDSVEVKLPESPGDGQVPSWHPSRRKRQGSGFWVLGVGFRLGFRV